MSEPHLSVDEVVDRILDAVDIDHDGECRAFLFYAENDNARHNNNLECSVL